MKKLSLLIVLCMTILSMTVSAYAASDVSDVSARLTEISKKTGYEEGTKNDASYCWNFVNKVSKALFGVSIPNGTGGRYYLTGAISNKDWYLVDKAYGTDATNSAVIAVLKQARAGDIIQYSNSKTGQHTAMIYAVSDSGISIYDSCKPFDKATYQKVRIYTCTWDTILNWSWSEGMGDFGGKSSYGISLYHCNKDVISDSATVTATAADSITQTSATLRSSFTTTGTCASECGMYIGTSTNNLKKLGSDKVNTYGTSMYYSTSKYGYTLEPDTTYYYQAYVIVDSQTYKGEVKSFTTLPNPKNTGVPVERIVLDRTSLTIKNGVCTQLTATTTPAGQKVTWTSSDPSVATVSSNGGIDTHKAGTTTITAKMTYNNTTYPATCKVTVTDTRATVTTKGADSITQTGAIVRGEVSVSSGTVTECGMYIGKSKSSLTKLGSDTISKGTTFYYSTSKYGYTLTAGTTYYYQAYAIVDGETIKGDVKSFITDKDVTAAIVTTKGADNISQTSAIVRGEVTVSSGTATECGMYIGRSTSNLSKLGSDRISKGTTFYYSTSKYGYNLTAGTTYYYQAYAIVDGMTIWGDVRSFTTEKAVVATTSAAVTTKGADNISQTSAIVRGEVTVSSGTVTECGMYIGKSASSLTKLGSDTISKGTTFYYSTSKYGYTLTAGTTYYYQAYAIVDGKMIWGDVKSFTTSAATVSTTTRSATVVNTNGQYLAINNAPAASPNYSTQIGRIPPGGTVTVDTSKTSGSWYWVTYNGVSGYAYGKYLSLN